ncbi:MAG TPA: ATP-binding protein [Methylomirabilota bacterium]|nr:ATP-binding protein [Methylomirabilota bacterium]
MKAPRRSLENQLALLVDASTLLGSGLPIDHALPRLARLAVPELGDLCAVDLIVDDGARARIAIAHANPARESLARALHFPRAVEAATRERNAVMVPRPTATDLSEEAESGEPSPLPRLNPRSWIVAPLFGADRVYGVLTFAITESSRQYDRIDLRMAVLIAQRAALAIEAERLGREAAAARGSVEVATRARDEFLATLSHELRNPLNAVLGWARLLEQGHLSDEQARRAVAIILRNVEAQARLVDDLLDLSTVVNGRMRLHVGPVDLGDLIRGVVEAMRPATDAKQIRLTTVLESPGGPVNGDADRLQQVMWNLIANAVKFTPAAGRVEVTLRRVRSHVEIVVADTGQGIPAALLPHVFDRLRQGDSSTTRAHGGLGIGLSLVRHLVELHGGSVTAESPGKDQGATFTVRLPLLVADVPELPMVSRESPSGDGVSLAGVRVLVVDDDPAAVDLVAAILRQQGAYVTGCTSTAAALLTAPGWRPDVVVSDIEMPEEDGYTLVRKLRALPPEAGGRTPVVALTAFGRPEDRIRSLRAGFNIHMAKPVDPDELIAVVANLAGRNA